MQTDDIFARIAVDRCEARNQHLVATEPVDLLKETFETLPLDEKAGSNAFKPLPKLATAADLREELHRKRKVMSGFLADLAPALDPSRIILSLEEFDWREETEEDRQNSTSTLAGAGQWTRVKIPHYGPPLGRAVTYYRVTFKITVETLQKGALFIAFDGVDYKAHVFINNAFLGSRDGFFAPFEFDFT